MKNLIENKLAAVGKKGSYAGIIGITAVLVQVVIDMIYSNQL